MKGFTLRLTSFISSLLGLGCRIFLKIKLQHPKLLPLVLFSWQVLKSKYRLKQIPNESLQLKPFPRPLTLADNTRRLVPVPKRPIRLPQRESLRSFVLFVIKRATTEW